MADLAVHPASAEPAPDPARSRTRGGRSQAYRTRLGRLWATVRAWAPWQQVLLAYALSRLVAAVIIELAALWLQNPAGVVDLHPDYWDMVVIWDGQWYRQIAEHGYPHGLPLNDLGHVDYNAWAFFPLFPMLLRAVMTTGLSFSLAATAVNLVAGAAAAVLLWHLIVARTPGLPVSRERARLAVLAVGIWCLLPPAAVLQVAYTEALAALLLAAALLLVVRRRYGWAVPVVLLLGLTRAVAAPLFVVVVWHGVDRWRSPGGLPRSQRTSLLVLGGATAASALLWPAIVGFSTGIATAFFQTQAVWGQAPAKGPFVPWISWAWQHLGIVGVLLLFGSLAALGSVVLGRHGAWLSPELRVWALVYPTYLLAVVRPITSMWRFMLLDLPLAAVLASMLVRGTSLGRLGAPHWRWRVAASGLAAVVAMSWWVGVLLTRTPWNDSPP